MGNWGTMNGNSSGPFFPWIRSNDIKLLRFLNLKWKSFWANNYKNSAFGEFPIVQSLYFAQIFLRPSFFSAEKRSTPMMFCGAEAEPTTTDITDVESMAILKKPWCNEFTAKLHGWIGKGWCFQHSKMINTYSTQVLRNRNVKNFWNPPPMDLFDPFITIKIVYTLYNLC